MQVFAGHTAPVQCGDFTPDGKRIITADAEGTLIFWDPRSPSPVFKLSASDARFDMEGITALAVNPASTLAVVGGTTGSVRVVSLSKGEVVGALGGHNEGESVEAVAFVELTPGAAAQTAGGIVVTGATDGKACIWDLSTNRLRATLEHEVSRFAPRADLPAGDVLTRVYGSERDLLAGRGDDTAAAARTEGPPDRVWLCGQDSQDVGRADRHPRPRAQRPPRSYSWGDTRARGRGRGQRGRRRCLPGLHDRVMQFLGCRRTEIVFLAR